MGPAAAAAGQGPATPSTDMTSISFRDQLWLNSFPLDRGLVFDYFALSPFYDRTCSNEKLRMRSIHPLDAGQLKTMTGVEYVLHEAQEPHLFVIRKQKRDGPERVNILSTYYILDGSIYQAPQLLEDIRLQLLLIFAAEFLYASKDLLPPSRNANVEKPQVRALHHITEAFSQAASKLEKFGQDTESAITKSDYTGVAEAAQKKVVDKAVDIKEAIRIDQILTGVFRRLPAAPSPPPFAFAPSAETAQPVSAQQQQSAGGEGAGTVSSELGTAYKKTKIEKQ